ncbi:DUF1192 domain-containing protein [Siccirubricoccus phaeus]|uniref:DUF1192 domain-containing protein n=1 Tax=Siccirubricoccus phaeus TaxID=2595053 RepID=UPI0011F31023|nr:DUF1192 domain-containing protein [Siccirubricoccus phaeus]
MLEEERPKPPQGFTPAVLESWGVEEMRRYIARLQAEIARVEAEIQAREAHRGAADALFRAQGG